MGDMSPEYNYLRRLSDKDEAMAARRRARMARLVAGCSQSTQDAKDLFEALGLADEDLVTARGHRACEIAVV